MLKLGCGGLKLGQRCVSLFSVKVSCLGMALMVVSFCVLSVSTLIGNSLGDDISIHFQFCRISPMELVLYCHGDSLLRLEIKNFTSQGNRETDVDYHKITTCGDGHEVGF